MCVCVCFLHSCSPEHRRSCLPNGVLGACWGAGRCAQQQPLLSRRLMAPSRRQPRSRTVAPQTLSATWFGFSWLHNLLVRGLQCQWGTTGHATLLLHHAGSRREKRKIEKQLSRLCRLECAENEFIDFKLRIECNCKVMEPCQWGAKQSPEKEGLKRSFSVCIMLLFTCTVNTCCCQVNMRVFWSVR